jgi:hypothetical protein
VGQLLYDGLQDAAGDAGGALTWPLLAPDGTRSAPSYSFDTDGSSGLYLADDGSVRIATEGSDAIGFDDRFITLGGQQTGVGRMSILSGSSGSPVYGFEGDIGTGIYRADSGVIGVSTGGVERLRVGASSTFKGDIQVDGNAAFKISSSNTPGYGMGQLKAGNGASLRLYSEGDANYANRILVNASLLDLDESTSLLVRGNATVKGNLKVEGIFTPEGGTAFGITEGIDTADVLDRAEVAAMPAPEEAVVDGLTVNEVVTALLLKVKALSAEIEELKGA